MKSFLVLGAGLLLHSAAQAQGCANELLTHSSSGGVTDGHSTRASTSQDGRYVAFESSSTNLVPGDTNHWPDVFVVDRTNGAIERVSVSSSGAQAVLGGNEPSISADGRYVAFSSISDDLVAGDTNGARDIFVRDRNTSTTLRISLSNTGFETDFASEAPVISADGRFVAFQSYATNLVASDKNGLLDVFVRDLQTNTNRWVSVSPQGPLVGSGGAEPAISADGRFVAFQSGVSSFGPLDTNNAADICVLDTQTGIFDLVSSSSTDATSPGGANGPVLSADGRYVAFAADAYLLVPNDLNNASDVFVKDRVTRTCTRISTSSSGIEGNNTSLFPSISVDGRFVAFSSGANNLASGDSGNLEDVFLHDMQAGTTTWISIPVQSGQTGASLRPSISGDGAVIAFESLSGQLAGNPWGGFEIYARDCPFPTGTPYCSGIATACPCANGGAVNHGCANSAVSQGASLEATGVASVTNDSVVLHVSGLPSPSTVLYFQGTNQLGGGGGTPYGDGLRCAGGTLIRLGTRSTSGGSGSFGAGVGSDPLISLSGLIPPIGATRQYQAWYRDNATFCSAQPFNFSNGYTIPWAP